MKKEIRISVDSVSVVGDLVLPKKSAGLVLFAHGSGSSRFSPRNQYVARILNEAGVGTLLLDLLTPDEDSVYENRFDLPLLTQRLIAVTRWAQQEPRRETLSLGYFGASTGAAAALLAAAQIPREIHAVVSRGGRPDLAMSELGGVCAPTLLIVGGLDEEVLSLNKEAFEALTCEKKLKVIPEATHLFEEPGTLEEVARLACDWFQTYL